MQTVGQIIRQRREAKGLTLTALADRVDSTKSYLSMIENHRVSNPPSETLLHACEKALDITNGDLVRAGAWQNTPASVRQAYQQVSRAAESTLDFVQWVKQSTAEANKGKGKNKSNSKVAGGKALDQLWKSGELSRRVNATLKQAKGLGDDGENKLVTGVDPRVPVRYLVPLINKVSAGYPAAFTDLDYPASIADEYVACPGIHDAHAFAARVVGQSMLPEYRQGDVVVFSPAAKVIDGCDCFVRIKPEHETAFKRVFFDGNNIRLQPLNPQYPPQVYERKQISGMYRAVTRMQSLV